MLIGGCAAVVDEKPGRQDVEERRIISVRYDKSSLTKNVFEQNPLEYILIYLI